MDSGLYKYVKFNALVELMFFILPASSVSEKAL